MQKSKHLQFYFLILGYLISFRPLLSADISLKMGALEQTPKITATAVEAQGKRDSMEDTHVYGEDGGIFYAAVYDGHGGKEVSDFLVNEETALHKLILKKIANGLTVSQALEDAYRETDAVIGSSAVSGGSTAVNMVIKDNILSVANIGDAEAMVFTKEMGDHPIVLTEIHKPTSPAEEARIIRVYSAVAITYGRLFGVLAISRAFGDFQFKKPLACRDFVLSEPHFKSLPLEDKHHYIILMCDGLREKLSHLAIADFIRARDQQGLDIETIAKELLTYALEESGDNVTFVLIKRELPKAEMKS